MAVLGHSWGICWRSWAALVTFVGGPGPYSRAGARSAALGSVVRCSWKLCWWSWVAVGAHVGDLGLLLGPKLAVLGHLGAGEEVLGPNWSVLGGIKAEKWPKSEREGRSGEGMEIECFRCPDRPVDFFWYAVSTQQVCMLKCPHSYTIWLHNLLHLLLLSLASTRALAHWDAKEKEGSSSNQEIH